ncbi:MAG: cyclase family protein [Bacteroidia bacterium]|nr:cyclase family protein [Bacteroidia bacterium]
MKLIDLTHTIQPNIPVFPGDDPVQLEQIRTLERDGFNNFRLSTGMHVGTHIDGPMHMTSDTKMMAELPLEMFAGKGVLIDVRGEQKIEFRESFRTMIQSGDIVLFYSGSDTIFGTPQYFTDYPDITEELALFLADQRVKIIGLDWVSPDHEPYPIHDILFKNNILILENLTNLGQLLHATYFEVFAFPLKIKADSSIVRVVARVKE